MNAEQSTSALEAAPNEIVVSRRFAAPRELVWRAFTEPEHFEKWWGPRGFTTTNHEHDLRVGGVWRHTMHGPDGTDYPNWSRFIEIEPPSRLSYIHGWDDGKEQEMFRAFITLEESGSGTLVTSRMVFPTAEGRNKVADEAGAVEGAFQHLDKLAEHLSVMRTFPAEGTGEAFVITRVFEAPCELVWRAWTEPEHLARWWGPPNMTSRVVALDLRPGGMYHYVSSTEQGHEMWGRFIFREVEPPRRLEFISSFSNPEGEVTRAPFAGEWPLEMLTSLTLDEQDGRTAMTLSSRPHNASAEETRTFTDGYRSMTQGWGGAFERLTALLKELGG